MSVFEGPYFHYNDESSEREESIAERTKFRRQSLDKITEKEKMIDHKLFKCTRIWIRQQTSKITKFG